MGIHIGSNTGAPVAGGAAPLGLPYMYSPTAAYAGATGMDNTALCNNYLSSSGGIGTDAPLLSFGNNFGCGYGSGMDMYSQYGMMGGMGYGMSPLGMGMGMYGDPTLAKMDPQQRLQYFNEMTKTMMSNSNDMEQTRMDYDLQRAKHREENERKTEVALRARESVVNEKARILQELASDHRLSQIPAQYNKFLESIRELYPNASEHEIKAIAAEQYDLAADLGGNSPFFENFMKGVGLSGFFTGWKDSRDIMAQATDVPISGRDRLVAYAGVTTGAATTLIAATALVRKGNLFENIGKFFRFICKKP